MNDSGINLASELAQLLIRRGVISHLDVHEIIRRLDMDCDSEASRIAWTWLIDDDGKPILSAVTNIGLGA